MSPTPGDSGARREVLADLASGAICLALAAGLAAVHFSQSGRLHEDYGAEPGPALLPELLLACLAIAGGGLALRGLIRGGLVGLPRVRGAALPKDWAGPAVGPVIVAIILVASFLPLRAWIGAAPALIALGAALGALAGRKERRSPARSAVEGAGVAIVLYALFRFVLSVPLT